MSEFNLIPEGGLGQILTIAIGVLIVLSPFITLAKK